MGTKEKRDTYFVARYSLIEEEQMTIKDYIEPKCKEDIFTDWLSKLSSISHDTVNLGNNEFKIYYIQSITTTKHLLKFGKKTDKTINQPTATDITSEIIPDYPNSYIIIDTYRQVLLIQKNNQVASKTNTFKNHLEKALNSLLEQNNVTIRLELIIKKSSFWDTIDMYEGKIEKVRLSLIPPNFLGQTYETSQVLKELKKQTNNDKLNININNLKGNLIIKKTSSFFSDTIEYISNGGGDWSIQASGNKSINSSEQLIEYSLDSEIENANNDKDLESILFEIDQIEKDNH